MAEPASVSSTPSTWKVGTLTYTRGGLAVLFAWLLWGDFAWSLRDRAIGGLMQITLKKYEVSDTMAAILLGTLPACIGFILGPIVSYCSDRHRGPRGRRIPFLIFSAPLVAVAIIGLGLSPYLGRHLHLVLGVYSPGLYPSIVMVIAAWWLLFDLAGTVTYGVFGALLNDVVPSTLLGRFYGLFRIISLLVGIGFNFWLLEKAESHAPMLFIGTGLIFGVGVVSMCLKVREGEYPAPPSSDGVGLNRFFGSARTYLRDCFTHSYYLWYFAGSNLALVAFNPVNGFSLFFAKSLHIETGAYGAYIATTYVVSLLTAYGLGSLADRWHPLRVGMLSLVCYAALGLWAGNYAATSRTAFAVALIGHGVFSGFYFTGAASLAQRMLPQATFAQYASASGIIFSILNIILPIAVGSILDWSGHDYRLTYFMGAGIALVALACLMVVYRYWKRLGGPDAFCPPQ